MSTTCSEFTARVAEARRRTAEANGSWLTREQCTQVVQMVKSLLPTAYVAAQFHLSHSRVRQICRMRGLDLRVLRKQRNEKARERRAHERLCPACKASFARAAAPLSTSDLGRAVRQ